MNFRRLLMKLFNDCCNFLASESSGSYIFKLPEKLAVCTRMVNGAETVFQPGGSP